MAGLWIVDNLRIRASAGAPRHVMRLADVELDELERSGALPDSYARHSWSAEGLETLISALSARLSHVEREIEAIVLHEAKRETIEEWTTAMLEERLARNEHRRAVQRLLEVARRSRSERAVLVFEGD